MFSKFCLSLKPCDHMLAKGPLCSPVNLVVVSIFVNFVYNVLDQV